MRIFIAVLLASAASLSLAESTFTYQGKLEFQGVPVTDQVPMAFRLYDGEGADAQQIGEIEIVNSPPVAVQGGLFQVDLDFGADAFAGGPRYLEIEVEGTIMSPRQRVRAAPVAAYAISGSEGPEGPPGPAGEDGADGEQGPPGESGSGIDIRCLSGGFMTAIDDDGTPVCSLAGIQTASAGSEHSCAVDDEGSLWCWGSNTQGKLGSGSDSDASVPGAVQVVSEALTPVSGITQVAVGAESACAIGDEGKVYCWGDNTHGKLGIDESDSDLPYSNVANVVQRSGGGDLTGIEAVSVGDDHVLARRADGQLFSWGRNQSGQLGDGSDSSQAAAVLVEFEQGQLFNNAVAISAGGAHSCAVDDGGSLWCWGDGSNGKLGNGSDSSHDRPVQVMRTADQSLASVTAISAGGQHSCAIADGHVYCWGNNATGQLGNGEEGGSSAWAVDSWLDPDDDGDTVLSSYISVSGGGTSDQGHSLAVDNEGRVYAWGCNCQSRLGPGHGDGNVIRPQVVSIRGVGDQPDPFPHGQSVAAGTAHSCAARADETLWCWGSNQHGRLGIGVITDEETEPRPVSRARQAD